MCGETRVRVGFGPLLQGPRNSPSLPLYIQPLGHRLDFGFCLDQKFAIAATSRTSFVFNDQTKASQNPTFINKAVGKTASTSTYGDGAPFRFGRGRRSHEEQIEARHTSSLPSFGALWRDNTPTATLWFVLSSCSGALSATVHTSGYR